MPPDVTVKDATVKKVSSRTSPRGDMGQTYLTSGKRVSMRLWQHEEPQPMPVTERDYETVGYVISGRAELDLEGQTVRLEPGDSWLVPAGARHSYRILEPLTAVEATSPPAQVHGRDMVRDMARDMAPANQTKTASAGAKAKGG
jgi:mannose-6-phosphate isomerase-like protein (cupin superfamily)